MLQIIKANQRGHADHGWLDTYHTLSFTDYYNSQICRMSWKAQSRAQRFHGRRRNSAPAILRPPE